MLDMCNSEFSLIVTLIRNQQRLVLSLIVLSTQAGTLSYMLSINTPCLHCKIGNVMI